MDELAEIRWSRVAEHLFGAFDALQSARLALGHDDSLSAKEIAKAMECVHEVFLQFSERHADAATVFFKRRYPLIFAFMEAKWKAKNE